MKALVRAILDKLATLLGITRLRVELEESKILTARLLIAELRSTPATCGLAAVEFKVFSQFGDDGILQYLTYKTGLDDRLHTFVEFGVSDYEESNTRFLLLNNNWRGLVIDGSARNIAHIRKQHWFWRYDLAATCAFITADNIDRLIASSGFSGDVGLLSIDIDGNDYWVWERIECISPIIVVAEYNSVFGPDRAISVPYDPEFRRSQAHYSNLYWGCSIKALEILAKKKGYALVGSNSGGNNVYFVRRDRLGEIVEVTSQEAFVESKYRESRNKFGNLTLLARNERIAAIRDMPVFDFELGRTLKISELPSAHS